MIMALILIPLSLVLLGAAVFAFFWAVDNDQFEDLDTVADNLVLDDVPAAEDHAGVNSEPPAGP